MYGRCEFKTESTDENDTESWPFPSNYERFSSVNVPRSRLGKRRTIDTTSEVKRDVLKGLSSETSQNLKIGKEENGKDFHTQDQFFTHPVNSSVTPHKIGNINRYNTQSRCKQETNTNFKGNLGSLTPFRKEPLQPLQEIKNLLNDPKFTPGSSQPPPLKPNYVSQPESSFSEIQSVLNRSFNATGTNGNEVIPHGGPAPFIDSHADSSQSDIGNNSSFMTAHDIYHLEKNRVQCDVKTPRKGFSLLDMLASPVDPVSNISLHSDNNGFKNLPKTPGFSNFENFKTPFKPNSRIEKYTNEMFTPTLKNIPRTPLVSKNCLKSFSNDKDSKCGDSDLQNKISSSEARIPETGNICVGSQSSIVDSKSCYKTSPTEESMVISQNEPSEIPKTSPSLEIKVKRRIFEGLGWSLPPSSFSPGIEKEFYQPKENLNKGISSVLLTPNNSMTDASKFVNECNSNLSEMEVDFNSIDTAMQSQCDLTPEYSVISVSNNDHRTIPIQSADVADRYKLIPEPCQQSLDRNSETDKERDPVKESVIEDETILSSTNVPNTKTSSLDTGFSNASDTQRNECSSNNFSTVMETSSTTRGNEETEMLTVQGVPCKETTTENDVTLIAPPPDGKCISKNCESVQPRESPDIIPDNTVKQPPKSQEESSKPEQPFVEPSKLPPQPLVLGCPRQVIKPESNVVYVNRKPYTVLSMLGRGGSSEVYQVLEDKSSKLMAMKFVNLGSVEESIATGYLNEIEVLTKLQGCPSVIRMFDSEYLPESKILYVIMEKGDTDFSRLMKDIMKTKKISMSMIIYYWTEMLSCVKDIHEKGIIHSDLKPANFLLVSGRLKLIDFGIASSLQGDMTSVLKDVTTGTFNYMSPEAIRNCGETRGYKITYKSDIWSLGCILYNLIYGRTPFSHLTNTWAKLGAIADPETNVSFPSDSPAPPHLLFSVRWALRKDPKERPTASELLKLAELTPGPESKLGRQISSLLEEYISQTFPNCTVKLEKESHSKDKQC